MKGSRWRHKRKGAEYEITEVANIHADEHRRDEYPVTISYRGDDGKVWSRPESSWHQDFELIDQLREGGE